MRLSDAIALGSTLIKAQRGQYYNVTEDSGCALGMAGKAIGWSHMGLEWYWPNQWLWATKLHVESPCSCTGRVNTVGTLIVHLFDGHIFLRKDWTLDRLVEWVHSVEPEEETNDAKKEKSSVEQGVEVGVV